jgi:hypothetical protein
MSTQSVTIKPNPNSSPSQPAVFSPQQVIVSAGDTVSWNNQDKNSHWPAPSVANPTGFIEFQIPAGSSSRGDLALGANIVNVVTAGNAPAVVFTTAAGAPVTGVTVRLTYAAGRQPSSPWAAAEGNFVATNLGANSFSVPLNSSAFGAFTSASGTISFPLAYTLNYVCVLHPAETGSIIVNPQS